MFALGVGLGCARVAEPAPAEPHGLSEQPPPAQAFDPAPGTEPSPEERHTASGEPSRARPWLGIELRRERKGVVVSYVYPNGPAASAGLLPGDVLQRVDGQPVAQVFDLTAALERVAVGHGVGVVAQRAGQERLFRVRVTAEPTREERLRAIYLGQPAPSISTLEPLLGTVVPSLEQLEGHVVVLEFWASFCVACRALTPELNRWHQAGEVLGLRVLGITMDPPDVALDAAEYFRIEYSVHHDAEGAVTRAYRGTALPTVYLLDRRGVVRDVVVGAEPERLAELYGLAQRLLREPR